MKKSKLLSMALIATLSFTMAGCSSDKAEDKPETKEEQKEEMKTFKEGHIEDLSVIANTSWELEFVVRKNDTETVKDESIKAGSATLEFTDSEFTFKDVTGTTYTGKMEIDAGLKACFLVASNDEFLIQFNAANQLVLSQDGSWAYSFKNIK